MEKIIINNDDFSLDMRIKDRLYKLYGSSFKQELPNIYDQLIGILNADNLYTQLVEDGANDVQSQKKAIHLLKIRLLSRIFEFDEVTIQKMDELNVNDENTDEVLIQIINDPKKQLYFETISLITEKVFRKSVFRILEDYVRRREPALRDIEGIKDINQCEFIIERYKEYVKSLSVEAMPSKPLINGDNQLLIQKGDLFHGTRYSEEVISSISNSGICSGQLHGISEDGETYFCADFFKAQKDLSPEEVCAYGGRYTNGKEQIVFVINHSDFDGPNALFPNLTAYDVYNEQTVEGRSARRIVNTLGLPLDYSCGASIMIGIPPCMISSIIVNSGIESDVQKIAFIASHFPQAFVVSRESGMVIQKPSEIKPDSKDNKQTNTELQYTAEEIGEAVMRTTAKEMQQAIKEIVNDNKREEPLIGE